MAASRIGVALAQLHAEVNNCEKALFKLIQMKKTMPEKATETRKINRQLQQTPIAIIGMASIFPQSKDLQEYWEKIIRKVDCITDVPPSRWSIEDYYDPNPKAPDKTYCKRGGFIPEINFNPMEFGIPPNILEVTDISQLLSLVVAKATMEDAGYSESRQFDREHTGVILGVALARQLAMPLGTRLQYPIWEKVLKSSGLSDEDTQKIVEKIKSGYVQWEENAFPGMLANIVAGRIANRLDLGGTNCVVDAACASSLGALTMAIGELVEHRANMMLTGGVDTDNSALAYMCFSKTPAVSPSENSKPFDADSDGMMLAEGLGMLLLKRLEDAEQDNDRIYAVIKGIGTSSDGRYKSIYAPRPEGQVRALRRAYENAGFDPASVGLIEAHGTGTMVGDPSEVASLKEVFGENNPKTQYIALGSVKSQIGHTKAAAGAASLIKTALALHHKVLPATINITKPHSKLNIETSPFYLNTETRPWIRKEGEAPRRAGVSSFGFGGTNYHIVLEEYQNEQDRPYRLHNTAQPILIFASTPEQLLSRCEDILEQLQSSIGERHYINLIAGCKDTDIPVKDARIGFVADSLAEARKLLQICIDGIKNQPQIESWEHPQGIYYRKIGMVTKAKVVALFSGQGSQYLEMGRELVINFPCLRQNYGFMDSLLCQDGLQPLSRTIFPTPVFDKAQKLAQVEALQRTEYSQPAIGVFSAGLYQILQQAGLKPDFVAGHSFGELTALWAAGVFSDEDYFFLVKARGQAMAAPKDTQLDAGTMLAVTGDVRPVEEIVKNFPQVTIANLNSNHQVVLAGAKAEIASLQNVLKEQGYSTFLLPVSAAFHTPLVAHAQNPFASSIERVTFNQPKIPVYTNVTGKVYPTEPPAIKKILKEHLINQVLFKQQIENIYAEGGYCFIEFGPKSILTNLVNDILKDKPHLAVALNASPQKDSDRCLREAVVQLQVAGLPLKNLDPYQLEQKIPEVPNKKELIVRLSASNYVSEKTKLKFEEALENGHQVKLNTSTTTIPATQSIPTFASAVVPYSNGNNGNGAQHSPTVQPAQHSDLIPMNFLQSTPELPESYQRVLDSLEYTLIEFNRHQRDILHVHEQSLEHQTEYTKTFFQLTQQQNSLLGNGKASVQEERNSVVQASSERSMMRFHDHQAQTLRIHEQYLNHQTEYTKNFFQLLQRQYEGLKPGDYTKESVPDKTSVVSDRSSLVTPLTTVHPIVEKNSWEDLPGNGYINSPAPVSTNGSSNGAVITSNHPISPPPHLPSTPPIDGAILSQALLNVVSDKTGYPVEMLELSMDMEADLGIDSIKRVEILGALLELYPDFPKPNPEELAQVRTLDQIVGYMQTLVSQISEAPTPLKEIKEESLETDIPEFPIVSSLDTPTSEVGIDFADLNNILLNIVSDKTGYPVEMLELSMDMEADLGIDSIKRVEILGALLELYPDFPKPNPEELAELRTLGQIAEYMQSTVDSVIIGVEEEHGDTGTPGYEEIFSTSSSQSLNILRSPVKLKVLPEPDILDFTLPDKHIALLTDDGSLTTSKLVESLTERGWKTVVLSFPQTSLAQHSPLPEGISRVVLTDWNEEHLKQQLEAIASDYGPIAAFIHLNPANHDNNSNDVRYLEAEKALLRHVFLIAKHLKEPLNQAARQGRSCFLTIARLDGELGLGRKTNFAAISGGLFGLTKSLNLEWEPVFCRAIDLSPDLDAERSVQYILAELHDPNRLLVEVGYGSLCRVTLVAESSPSIVNSQPSDQSQVFLVSGGAKGITAECVIKLAEIYKCKFILLGRSKAYPEPVWAEGCLSEAELKKRIVDNFLTTGEKPTPIMVQREFNSISSRRQIEKTLFAIASSGGQAEYLSVDVTDALALSEQVSTAVERLGAVTGIIHGAGNLADKRIEKKSEQDFETVYNAKVKGLENLLRCVTPSQLNHLVLFSSVVGFYGNAGQSDYALANEILNKSAHLVKRNHPNCHVVTINWGPWDAGMVSPELKKAFAERNIETIPIDIGTQMLVDELAGANQEVVQIVIGSPIKYTPEALTGELKKFRIQRRLTLAANPFLQDHVIANRAVLPATCAMSWIANTCEQLYPGYKFFSCQNFKVLKGIVFEENLGNAYTLDLEETDNNGNNEIEFHAKIWSNNSEKTLYHFSAQLKLKRQIPVAPSYESLNLERDETTPYSSTSFYQSGESSLFHGESFQGVKTVLNISPEKITIECILPTLKDREQGQFPVQTFNPYIVDVNIHPLWIWTQYFHQEGCLPSEIKHFEQFAEIPFDETFYMSCEIQSKTDSAVVANVIAHNLQGQIYSRMLGAKGTVLPNSLITR
ncbi:MAG: SDR family NAD(P)-dependent oxidoreductase [Cyanomargarita calcarea GSE-NOS-MK-12-04C]|uniref:SDR family NAD(P)-dependent oxidoreductase n=1 Tax=Cyanomargarita calcarea GSE-NOS-MK-12-04C TaxID=2839659 RepID=A0A951UUX5_9CYAN|nr:SDR family NAD(P)-dependent oxidoreductase [Cyanomargarita calcarea GSE-NOS-MK-12-04C]